jgi:hypothetical protein
LQRGGRLHHRRRSCAGLFGKSSEKLPLLERRVDRVGADDAFERGNQRGAYGFVLARSFIGAGSICAYPLRLGARERAVCGCHSSYALQLARDDPVAQHAALHAVGGRQRNCGAVDGPRNLEAGERGAKPISTCGQSATPGPTTTAVGTSSRRASARPERRRCMPVASRIACSTSAGEVLAADANHP